jgi:transposase-like protein
MSTPPLTDEQLRETAALYTECDGNQSEMARRLGLARSTLQNRVRQAARFGFLGTTPVLPGYRISRISTLKRGDGVDFR